MTGGRDADRVWKLIEKIGFCMLSTHDGEDIRARPMAAHIDRDEHAIYFLTDRDSHKDEDIERNPNVGLAFANTGGQKYVSLTGHAALSNDRQKIRELWSTPAKAWWDSPGTVVSYVKMLAAVMTDSRPAVGDSAKVKL